MTLSLIGLVQAALGLLLIVKGELRWIFAFLLLSSLFGGSSAIQIGSSSVPPVQFALLFVLVRVLLPRGGFAGAVPEALRANLLLFVFVLYGIVAAYAAPRIFAGQLNVVPLRFDTLRSMFDTIPLYPTAQNVTTSIYLAGTLFVALSAFIVCRFRGGAQTLVQCGVWIAWFHTISGIIGIALRGTPLDLVFEFFRNANYAQLDQSYEGFIRINGVWPEASAYAGYGFAWFAFNAECWYRGILPRRTGPAAIILCLVLFFSTSGTAYIGLAGYATVFALRALLFPAVRDNRRLVQVGLTAVFFTSLACLAIAVVPHMPAAVWDMIVHMTLDKQDSDSGQQRMFWALQGWDAFVHSFGLGIGPGSFRSSSLLTSILGSMGLIGIVTFVWYVLDVLQLDRASTWGASDDIAFSVGGAAAFAAFLMLIPASISAPSPDPGMTFAIFCGAALSLRPRREAKGTRTQRDGPVLPRRTVIAERGTSP